MHRTRTAGRRNRTERAAIMRETAGLGPAVSDELQRYALARLAAWCARPGRRNTTLVAWCLLDMIEQAAKLDNMLDGAIRATVTVLYRDRLPLAA